MKKYICVLLLTVIIGSIEAANTNSLQLNDHLLKLRQPERPAIVDDSVVFTASSGFRRVGIAFAHEHFGKIYWFEKLMVSNDNSGPWIKNRPPPDIHRDSGILFYIYPIPDDHTGVLEYRLIIDGLWVKDPVNPDSRVDSVSGITRSVVALPYVKRPNTPERMPAGTIVFSFTAPEGETITVAGSFNNWDPFMYELREISSGHYALSLPVPPGVYQYVYFYRGERRLDPNNPNRIYTREGKAANEITVK
jgi:hypothetical protein